MAAQFSVSIPFISNLLRRKRLTGSVAALPHRSGPAPVLGPVQLQQLDGLLRQQPDATLDELRQQLAAQGGPAVSRATVGRAVVGLDWRRKKRVFTPPSATLSA